MNGTKSAGRVSDRTLPGWYFHCPLRRLLGKPSRRLDYCGPAMGDVVADLGAGGGYFLAELGGRIGPSGRIYAVDVDQAALDVARGTSRFLPCPVPTEFVHASAGSVPQIPSGNVDFVLANGLLCCTVDKKSAIDEMWRILRPGGRALVTFVTIGPRFTARGRAVRMTDGGFRELLGTHPWWTTEVGASMLSRRYGLTKAV